MFQALNIEQEYQNCTFSEMLAVDQLKACLTYVRFCINYPLLLEHDPSLF